MTMNGMNTVRILVLSLAWACSETSDSGDVVEHIEDTAPEESDPCVDAAFDGGNSLVASLIEIDDLTT